MFSLWLFQVTAETQINPQNYEKLAEVKPTFCRELTPISACGEHVVSYSRMVFFFLLWTLNKQTGGTFVFVLLLLLLLYVCSFCWVIAVWFMPLNVSNGEINNNNIMPKSFISLPGKHLIFIQWNLKKSNIQRQNHQMETNTEPTQNKTCVLNTKTLFHCT